MVAGVGIALSILVPGVVQAAPDCIPALNRAGYRVARAVSRETQRCLALGEGARLGGRSVRACVDDDVRERISRARDGAVAAEATSCGVLPGFGVTNGPTVADAAQEELEALGEDVLGDLATVEFVPAPATADARCRKNVVRTTLDLTRIRINQFGRCARAGLKRGVIDSTASLEACFDEIASAAHAKVGAAVRALERVVADKCEGLDADALLPGACTGAPLAACLDSRSACRTCRMLGRSGGLERDCDVFDDGVLNASCTTPCEHPGLCAWRFEDVTSPARLTYAHAYDETQLVNPERERAIIAGGVAVGDYDGDGWMDVYAVGGPDGGDRLLRNLGDSTFEDESTSSGISRPGTHGSGPTFADYDGDGRVDLLVGGVNGANLGIYRNLGDGTFSDATSSARIAFDGSTFGSAFGDYDRDGDLDVYLAHWQTPIGDSPRLWRNNGNGTFTDVTAAAEIDVPRGPVPIDQSFTPNFADVNSDGWPDLLIAADFGASQVFLNDQDGTFTDVTSPVISDENGMGAAVGDYDNDGDLDWFVTSITDPDGTAEGHWGLSGNRLYRNRGDGTFEDATDEAGVREGYWGWGACMEDFDLDGHPDLFHVNGFSSDSADNFYTDPSRLFLSDGNGAFVERSEMVGLTDDGQGRGVACFDYDRDGDIDILVANNDQAPRLWENGAEVLARNFLHVRLIGNRRNSQAVGARVYATTVAGTQMREIRAGSNFASQSPAAAHFGLGAAGSVDLLRVEWPDGAESLLPSVPANQWLEISHPDAIPPEDVARTTSPRFSCAPGAAYCNEAIAAGLADMTRYARGATVVDVDGDGREDLFLVDSDNRWSPTSWGVSQFFRNTGGAHFTPVDLGVLGPDLISTWAAPFADYDNDGDPDLLLVNGGYSGLAHLALYENRLDVSGEFVPVTIPSGLEAIANGTLSAWWGASWADYDSDGYLDVVVTRLLGTPLVLHNEGDGTFTDVGAVLGVTIVSAGQGKNPVWFDYDQDGDPDLYIAGLYEHAFYRNDGGVSFVDVTSVFGPPLPGAGAPWVFAAASDDFDQDGLEDLYLGRQGLQDLVLRNDGAGGFVQMGAANGLDAIVTENTMGLGVGDLFDDGWPDVLIGTGEPSEARPDLSYCNVGAARFARCTDLFYDGSDGPWRTRAHGTVFGDFDEDGRTDVLVNLGGAAGFDAGNPSYDSRQYPALYLQQPPFVFNTASILLEGTSSNRDAVGARVRVVGTETHYYGVRSMQAFQGQNGRWLRLALGSAPSAEVTITWPSGTVQTITVVAGARTHVVEP